MPYIALLLGIVTSVSGWFGYQALQQDEQLGAFGDPFLSIQLADSPSNGQCLKTDGTDNSWAACAAGGSSEWTDNGAELEPNEFEGIKVDYVTATSTGTSSTFVNASTTLLTFTTAWGNVTGALTGNADTATALSANGGNCSSGNSPLGVDASGAVEDCFDVWTEAENTAAAYTSFSPTDIDTDYGDETVTSTWDFTSTTTMATTSIDYWLSDQGNYGLELTDDGTDLVLRSDVDGQNSFFIRTAGTFLSMIANPNAANDDLMFSFAETQGDDTYINFYEGGVGNNRIWNSGSMRLGGNANSLCSDLTSDVDCDTAGTGADLVVQDDIWAGGSLISGNASTTLISGTNAWFTSVTAALTGNADTATALAANGANCTSGNAPLGVDASGAVESCFDVWTEAENTAAGYITGNETITLSGDVTGTGATSITTALAADVIINADLNIDVEATDGDFLQYDSTGDNFTWRSATELVADIETALEAVADFAWTGIHNFGGATSVEIPNGTNPTTDAAGEIALDTTDNQLIVDDGTTDMIYRGEDVIFKVTVASTSEEFVSGGVIPIPPEKDGFALSKYRCYVDGGTSVVVNLSDGTNDTETITCATTLTSDDDVATNDTFTAGELAEIQIGTITGTPDYLSFTAYGHWTRE